MATWSRQRPTRPAARGRRAAVAAARRASVEAALAMLEAGGNAADAAIAAGFVAGVIEPMETTLAGSGFLMVHAPDFDGPLCVEFGPRAPRAARADMFRVDSTRALDRGLGVSVVEGDANVQGVLAAGVPATIPGLCAAQARFGRLALAQVLAPAIAAAHGGFPADPYFSLEALANLSALRADAGAATLFLRGGVPPIAPHLGTTTLGVPDMIRQPALGRTLEIIAGRGAEAATSGETAAGLLATHRELGGLLAAEDLERAAHVAIRPALMGDLGGGFTAAVPSAPSGGATVLQMLAILRALGRGADAPGPLLHAAWHAFADRYHWLGDPEEVPVPLAALVSAGYASDIAGVIRRGVAPPLPQPGEGPPWEAFARRAVHHPWPHENDAPIPPPRWTPATGTEDRGGTTHISVLDAEGFGVSLTHTAANHFGAKVVCPRTGLLLDAAMGWFNAAPGAANSIASWRRPLANMAPSLLLREGAVHAAIGAPGGRRIIPAVAALLQLMADGRSAEEALAAPRADGSGDVGLLDEAWAAEADELRTSGLPVRLVSREHAPYGYELARPMIAARTGSWLAAAADPFSPGHAAAL